MKCLILAAGRFGDSQRSQIVDGRQPRLDVFEIADALRADVFDFADVDRSTRPSVRLAARLLSPSAAVATLAFRERHRYDAFFTTGEDIGLPLAALLKAARARCSHTMIAHTLFPAKKRMFFKLGAVADRIDCMLVYATSEERLAIESLGMPARKVRRIAYHADERFFRPDPRPPESDLICAAGQLLRDYECLVESVRGKPVRVQIAAGSPWISRSRQPGMTLPSNVSWGRLDRYELRELYARSAVAVVPILQNHYQTGIATILEMMAMGKCVIATRTHGQTDTIVDGETGIYVPPHDPRALWSAIERALADPAESARIGLAARRFVEERAGLDRFVANITDAVRAGHQTRFGN
jgi:glycosyltransferase involved in cell wall biosynthesis